MTTKIANLTTQVNNLQASNNSYSNQINQFNSNKNSYHLESSNYLYNKVYKLTNYTGKLIANASIQYRDSETHSVVALEFTPIW
ncbi:hypothetical protein [Candidatus Tisiphia endosymbiont of Hybos culiciformis]